MFNEVFIMQTQYIMVAALVLVFILSTVAQFSERTDAAALLYGLVLLVIFMVAVHHSVIIHYF